MAAVHEFSCRFEWTGAQRGSTTSYDTYSREHRIDFDGKPPLVGSAAPAFRGDPALYNPEDLLVASLCSCHCLSYLALCARAKIAVVGYQDQALGTMRLIDHKMRFTEVLLRPRVSVAEAAEVERARALHEKAHEACFIANSVSFPVRNEPTIVVA